MQPGLTEGSTATVSTRVTRAMTARLGGQEIHPLLATAQMIEWMEWAGRTLILPYLDHDEDAIGYAVDVVHVAPTLVGETFGATATFRAWEGTRLIADVVAFNQRGIIGRGVFTQVVVSKETLASRIQKLLENRPPD